MNLCRASEKKTALVSKQIKKNENPTQDFSDEDYGQLLDIVEGLKIHLVSEEKYADDLLDETTKFFSGIAESSTTSEDDRDVLLAKSTERRGSKPS